jgi:hypothetical protein
MRGLFTFAGLLLAATLSLMPASAQTSDRCQNVTGRGVWTLIPSPQDPLGRVLGPTSGVLKGSVSAYLTTLIAKNDGAFFEATSTEVWMVGPQDLIIFSGKATFTPIPGEPIGTVADALTLTAIGGTGVYAGATGVIEVKGVGRNLFGPYAGPGNTFFDIAYKGNICRLR